MDVTFLTCAGKHGEKIRRFQFTTIDDPTRVRALRIYEKQTQANVMAFVDHIIKTFPFRIREIRTDNGHEVQAKFHWHVEYHGIRHASIKRATPSLNGKVECSYRSDQQELYQLLSDKGDADPEAKLEEWERFCNFTRPHGAFNGRTPYEALREKLQLQHQMSQSACGLRASSQPPEPMHSHVEPASRKLAPCRADC